MNPDLAEALGEIERGVERCLQVRGIEFERLQQELGEGQKIVRNVEKVEEPEAEEAAAKAHEVETVQAEIEIMETTGR